MDTDLKVAHEKLETLLSDEETLSQAWERERAILEYNSLMSSAREEGREEGIEQGIEIGREEERKIQEAILMLERQKQEAILVQKQQEFFNKMMTSAKALLSNSMSIEEVSQIVGLSVDEIKDHLER